MSKVNRNLILFLGLFLASCGSGEETPREPTRMTAGYAQVDITPEVGYPLGGFGAPGGLRVATGVHDPILAQVVWFANDIDQNLVIVANDSAGYFYDFGDWGPGIAEARRRIVDEVAGESGIEPEHVLVTSSHTHSGPDLMGFWQPVGQGPPVAYLESVASGITGAARRAFDERREVELLLGHAELSGYSRRDGPCSDVIDNGVEILQVKDGGQVMLTLVNYANHPTMLAETNTELTADFVWGFRETMDELTGAPAVFLQGYIAAVHSGSEKPEGEGFDRALDMGRALADAANGAALEPSDDFGIDHRSTVISCPVEGAYALLAYYDIGNMKRYVDDDVDPPLVENLEVSWHRLGPAEFAVMPGEPTPETSLFFKQRMLSPFRFTVGLGNDSIGYLIDQESIDKDTSGQLAGYELEMGVGRPGGPATIGAMESLGWYDGGWAE